MKQIFVLATSLLLVTLYSPHVVFAQEMTPANSSTLPSVDVVKVPAVPSLVLSGTWDGHWEGRLKGGLTVVFETENAGTLVATGTNSFGTDPKPLRDVQREGNSVRFKGGAFDVRSKLDANGETLIGEGWYQGYKYDVFLSKKK